MQVSKDVPRILGCTSDRKLGNVYAGAEMWVYMENPRMSMWIRADVARPAVSRRPIGTKWCMFFIEFSKVGLGAIVMLPPRQRVNRDFFGNTVLSSLIDDRALSRRKLKVRGMFLPLDNARPHLIHPTTRIWLPATSGYLELKESLERPSFDNSVRLQVAESEILMSIEVGSCIVLP
jgi:hypothetical protein